MNICFFTERNCAHERGHDAARPTTSGLRATRGRSARRITHKGKSLRAFFAREAVLESTCKVFDANSFPDVQLSIWPTQRRSARSPPWDSAKTRPQLLSCRATETSLVPSTCFLSSLRPWRRRGQRRPRNRLRRSADAQLWRSWLSVSCSKQLRHRGVRQRSRLVAPPRRRRPLRLRRLVNPSPLPLRLPCLASRLRRSRPPHRLQPLLRRLRHRPPRLRRHRPSRSRRRSGPLWPRPRRV